MKKKLILVTFAAALLLTATVVNKVMNPLNLGISPLRAADGQEQTGRRLTISFAYNNLALVASNQYAIWIEDMDGNYIDTLYVTRYTAQEGHRRRPNSIPGWVAASQRATMPHLEVDAISGATPRPGDYIVSWDFTDSNGASVEGTEYRYFIEASLMNDDLAIYSGVITLGDEAWEDTPVPEYDNPDSEYKAMLSDVRVAYAPN